ncbi:MAG: hypothetical protein A2677_01025 [Candidatus Komeilibacteria bacterium RIFCSPHIGHO2_01_FULL_52_14]|uniref:Glycosyl transferase family 1 domain-containing protein n=1 Tax=Candidatus Komeilibacteria bacterium RIFCSPHIGHO2_01_FULL_52_14 TaxID=1798549 RepID=A0A1G2BNU7_9BACT|nr:MAG: hypothetical protein A2677_01025 [Candidatus Komeilibacteria bacterium RIFCSPHIGHO2_01_FULL_52_14]
MQPEPTIALAHDHLYQIGGAESVLKTMADLYPSAPIYTLIYNERVNLDINASRVRTSFLQHAPGGKELFKWYLGVMPSAWQSFDFTPYQVILSSSSAFVKGIVTPASSVHISYCHTPTRYLWSDSAEYVRSLRLSAPLRTILKRVLDDLREWDYQAAQRVDYFIANSRFIARRIEQYYHRDSVVIYPPVSVQRYRTEPAEKFYLLVSRLRPYKKVDVAIEAFNQLKLPLYIIGAGEEYRHLKSRARKNIRFLGEVSDATKISYMSRCRAFIHPQEEDFGISAVEAMASGKPVIAYASGGVLETVIPNVTGIFFKEQTWEALAYAVLASRQRDFDAGRIRQHAMQFNEDVFKQSLHSYVQSIVPSYANRH